MSLAMGGDPVECGDTHLGVFADKEYAALMVELFLSVFVTLFVVIDPPGVTPIFGALTEQAPTRWKRLMAVRSVSIAFVILLGFAIGGEWLLGKLHISLDAFRAAGGVLLFLIAIDMLFETRTKRREDRAEKVLEDAEDVTHEDVSVFPVAIPLLAGPGAIASMILFMGQNGGNLAAQAVVLAAMALILLICFVLFFFIGAMMKIIGPTVGGAITRVLGILLAALAAQFIIDGVTGAFGLA